jgi:hypothetical protein
MVAPAFQAGMSTDTLQPFESATRLCSSMPILNYVAALVTAISGFNGVMNAAWWQSSQPAANLQPARTVAGNVLTSRLNPAARVRVDKAFRYVGGHRFILRDVADAEQHFFVVAGADGVVQRLYWIQFEHYLPGRGGVYDYSKDVPLSAWGMTLRTHVRRFVEPPAAGSDRQQVHQFLSRSGLTMPATFVRARVVYVPGEDRRQELMIIYVERDSGRDLTTEEQASLVQRAVRGLEITR